MLGKLIKHELRATRRKMLPMFGVLALLALLSNVSLRMADADLGGTLMRVLTGIFVSVFFIGIIVAWVMALVLMISRYYRNLLKDEGYLSFTLPTNAHALVWAKLIVSSLWFLAVSLLSLLLFALTVLNVADLSGADLGSFFRDLEALSDYLREEGVTGGNLVLLGLELIAAFILSCLTTSLHFYAAMGIGQMSATKKALWSVLSFIGISIVFRIVAATLLSGLSASGSLDIVADNINELVETVPGAFKAMNAGLGWTMLAELLQCAVLYFVSVLTLQKKLNLA
ncbi:MAG: hypothetical protein K6G17_05245 [Oscillospiraceae bacterium]|nr:hypothetical protein [Oscillospiraceae bacterium]